MAIIRSIRLKALLLLVAFAANFTVFCHCATAQKRHGCCCEKQSKTRPCNSAKAVKFNLTEKQMADHVHLAPLPVVILLTGYALTEPARLQVAAVTIPVKHPPPDILTLQGRLLI